jgi:hypothetical protein
LQEHLKVGESRCSLGLLARDFPGEHDGPVERQLRMTLMKVFERGEALLGPTSTVRGWLRRFAGRGESVRAAFTALAVDVDPGTAPPLAAGTGFADAVAAVLAAIVAVLRRWPGLRLTVSPWLLASAVSRGGLLAPARAVELINTSRLWAGLW